MEKKNRVVKVRAKKSEVISSDFENDETINKLNTLKKNFDLLKDKYNPRDETMDFYLLSIGENIIIPMLELSLEDGCDAWLYLLKKYYLRKDIAPVFFNELTDHVFCKHKMHIIAE